MRDITKLEQVNFHSHVELGGEMQMSCDVGYLNQTNMSATLAFILVKLDLKPHWEGKILKMTKRLDIWKSMGLSMLARANICMTLIPSCARYHASCATPSPDQTFMVW